MNQGALPHWNPFVVHADLVNYSIHHMNMKSLLNADIEILQQTDKKTTIIVSGSPCPKCSISRLQGERGTQIGRHKNVSFPALTMTLEDHPALLRHFRNFCAAR